MNDVTFAVGVAIATHTEAINTYHTMTSEQIELEATAYLFNISLIDKNGFAIGR